LSACSISRHSRGCQNSESWHSDISTSMPSTPAESESDRTISDFKGDYSRANYLQPSSSSDIPTFLHQVPPPLRVTSPQPLTYFAPEVHLLDGPTASPAFPLRHLPHPDLTATGHNQRLLVGHHQPSRNHSFSLALSAPLRRQEG
jgi:hypothetical protein